MADEFWLVSYKGDPKSNGAKGAKAEQILVPGACIMYNDNGDY